MNVCLRSSADLPCWTLPRASRDLFGEMEQIWCLPHHGYNATASFLHRSSNLDHLTNRLVASSSEHVWSGPYKVNGVPLRRINRRYVICTSTKIDISSVKFTIPRNLFKREKRRKYRPRKGAKPEERKNFFDKMILVCFRFDPFSPFSLLFCLLCAALSLRTWHACLGNEQRPSTFVASPVTLFSGKRRLQSGRSAFKSSSTCSLSVCWRRWTQC